MQIIVDLTGPDHEPTTETKWYAQAEQPPVNISRDYAFGSTPQEALVKLIELINQQGVTL